MSGCFFLKHGVHSCARSVVTEVQMHEIDLLLECIYSLEMAKQHCPVGFLGQMYKKIVNYICIV